MKSIIALLLLASSVSAQTLAPPTGQLLIVPTAGAPDRAETLQRAGLIFGRAEGFAVGSASPRALAAVRSKGWPYQVVRDPSGSRLYLVRITSPAEIPTLAAIAELLHASASEALVAADPAQERALFTRPLRGHNDLMRLERTALRSAPPVDGLRRKGRGALDSITPHPDIQALVAQVSQANLQARVAALSALHTRRSDQPGGLQAQNQLLAAYQAIPGLSVSTHDFDSGADNIVAVLPGTVDPSRIVVLGGHYDSISGQGASAPAPGADDNASGSSAVLECARLLSQQRFEYSIYFLAFASEEFGLVGSNAYAQMLANQGADVIAMVNTDMNAYRRSGEPLDVVFITNDSSAQLNAFGIEVAAAYVPGLAATTASLSGGTSDHRSFQRHGFPATFPFEDVPNYSPYIHGPNDIIGTSANDFQLSQEITQLVLAMTAELAVPASIDLRHTPLGDTADTRGPYRVLATAASRVGSTISSLSLEGAGASGSFSVSMVPAAAADEWIGDIPGQPTGTTIRYHLEARDAQGRTARFPRGGAGGSGELSFRVGNRASIYTTDFESGPAGWTHGLVATQDDWQLGAPQGQSGDPSGAHSGSACWANDLGNSGWNGAYANNTHNWLRSPIIDCSGESGVHLEFMRWLSVEDGYYDQARILVNGTEVWSNPATPGGGTNHLIDTSWQAIDLDISALADNNPAVQIEFRLQSDGGLTFGGWNIDDLALTAPRSSAQRSLFADRSFISVAAGTPLQLEIALGAGRASELYLVLAGFSGSSPGFAFNGATVPLNYDPLTEFVLMNLSLAPIFRGFSGQLDGAGHAVATLDLPGGGDPLLVGVDLSFAALTLNASPAVTTPLEILMVR